MSYAVMASLAAAQVGLRAIHLVPAVDPWGVDRVAGHVIVLEYDPMENDARPFRLLWWNHEMSERTFFTLPPDAVQLIRFS